MYNGYYYGFDTTYLVLVVPALLIALIAQIQVKSAFDMSNEELLAFVDAAK